MLDNAKATDAVSRCLIEADIAAHAAFVCKIKQAFPDPIAERRVREYLSNPVFRPLFEICHNGATSLGRVDKRDSQDVLNVIQAGICDGDQLGTRPDV